MDIYLTAPPEPGAEEQEIEGFTRKDFLSMAGWGALTLFLAGFGVASARFMLPNVLYEPPTKYKIGKPGDYLFEPALPTSQVTVDDRWMSEHRIWVVRTKKELYVLWGLCTHLGCTPKWWPDIDTFKCPCHGSNYNSAGDVIAGPAPKALFRFSATLAEDGQILVDSAMMEDLPGKRDKTPFVLNAPV